jgi:hypothetical protein
MSQTTSDETINCLGSQYSNTVTTVIATLNAITTVNVLVRVYSTYTNCFNQTFPVEYFINIDAGALSGFSNITTTGYVDCGGLEFQACATETRTIDSYEVVTSNFEIC